MPFDPHANLASSIIVTAPSPELSGTTLTVSAGQAALFPNPSPTPFNCTVCPFNTFPTPSNSEIVRVMSVAGDTFTVMRAQEGTTAKPIAAGWLIANSITAKTLTDIEAATGGGGSGVSSVSGLAPVVSSGGTTPEISMPVATASDDGYLSSADWNTFNNKQPAGSYLTGVTADAPLSGSGTSGSHLVISQAGSGSNGYLSSTDWNTFNGKQGAGNYITALTGDVSASGPGSAAATLATVNSNVGTFGSSTAIPVITVNGKGLATAASTVAVIAPAGTLSGTTLASNVVGASLNNITPTGGTLTVVGSIKSNLVGLTTSSELILTGDAGQFKQTLFMTGSANRWNYGCNGDAESGANAGSNFILGRWDDAGVYIQDVFGVERSTGDVTQYEHNNIFRYNGIGATSTTVVEVANFDVATSGLAQWSPALHFKGDAWRTGAANRVGAHWKMEVQTPSSTSGTNNLVFSSDLSDTPSYSPRVTMSEAGLTVVGGISSTTLNTIDFDSSSGSLPALINGDQQLRISQDDGKANGIQADSWAATGLQLYARRSGGTRSSPSVTQTGPIMDLLCYGYTTTYTTTAAGRYQITAKSNWSTSSAETQHNWFATPLNSTTAALVMVLDTGGLAVTGASTASTYIKPGSYIASGLPSAATAGGGAMAYVTDANATTRLSVVAGGGSNKVMVFSDGINWLII